ncbi:MAG: hypothetical protein ACMXYC_03975 [Candidatus Woesearchaeota archaeon]
MSTPQQIQQFLSSAQLIYNTGDYPCTAILYFKTLFALHDYMLLQKIGYAPKDHTERFRLLEEYFPDAYKVLDKEFNTYRDTYNNVTQKITCDRIRGEVLVAISSYT